MDTEERLRLRPSSCFEFPTSLVVTSPDRNQQMRQKMGGRGKWRVPLVALLAGSFGAAGPVAANSDAQWVYREEWGSGPSVPTAIYLSWDLSAVIFRATCEPALGEIHLIYFGDAEVPISSQTPALVISAADRDLASVTLETRFEEFGRYGQLVGKVKVDAPLLKLMKDGDELEIEAPNAMQEPFYVGRSDALRKVIAACAAVGHEAATVRP